MRLPYLSRERRLGFLQLWVNVCLRLGEFSSGTFQVLVFRLVHPCPSEPSADPSAGSPVPSVSPTPVCVSAQSGQLSSSQVRSLNPQQPPHLGAAPERDPGASRAVFQARNPPSSSSFGHSLLQFRNSCRSFPDLQCHVLGRAVRAASVWLTIYLRELHPHGWVTVWNALARRSDPLLVSCPASVVCPCPRDVLCQARGAAPRGDPGDSGSQRGPPPPGSHTGSPPYFWIFP